MATYNGIIYYSDNDLIKIFIDILNTRLNERNWPPEFGVPVVQQKQQPTQQGVPSTPVIFIEKLFSNRYGYPQSFYIPDGIDDLKAVEYQLVDSTFQFAAMVAQNPKDSNMPTANDLLQIVCQILQSRVTIGQLAVGKIGLLRVTDVRNPYFTNDRDRQEAHPTFDMVVNHNWMIQPLSVPKVQSTEADIHRI